MAAAADRRKLAVIVHGASHPLPPDQDDATAAPEPDGAAGNGEPQRRKAVRVADVSAFKRARALFPLRPQPALQAVAVPPATEGAAVTE